MCNACTPPLRLPARATNPTFVVTPVEFRREGDSKRSPPPLLQVPSKHVRHPAPTPWRPAARCHQHAVVAPPSPALLGNAIFQHRHPRTEKAANDRLNHACPEVEALEAGRAIEDCMRVGSSSLGFRFAEAIHSNAGLPQNHLQFLHPHIDVRRWVRHHLSVKPHARQRERVDAMRTRHAKRPRRVGGRSQAARPSHDQYARHLRIGRGLQHMTFHRRLGPSHP